MARILIHTCCGPCTLYPLRVLRASGWTVHGFFFNPNIQPCQEYLRRLEALREVSRGEELPLIVRDEYDPEAFFRNVAFREGQRCVYCYSIRLDAAARLAKKSRFDAFTTTLLYSRQQKHELVRTLAEEASRRHGVPFHYEDFRAGWKEGQERARAMNIYRQQYCGCIYSEKERYWKENAKDAPEEAD